MTEGCCGLKEMENDSSLHPVVVIRTGDGMHMGSVHETVVLYPGESSHFDACVVAVEENILICRKYTLKYSGVMIHQEYQRTLKWFRENVPHYLSFCIVSK